MKNIGLLIIAVKFRLILILTYIGKIPDTAQVTTSQPKKWQNHFKKYTLSYLTTFIKNYNIMVIEVSVTTGIQGARRTRQFDVYDGLSEEEIEEIAFEYMIDLIEWDWKKVE